MYHCNFKAELTELKQHAISNSRNNEMKKKNGTVITKNRPSIEYEKKTSQNIARFPSLADCLDSAELVCCVFSALKYAYTHAHMLLLSIENDDDECDVTGTYRLENQNQNISPSSSSIIRLSLTLPACQPALLSELLERFQL